MTTDQEEKAIFKEILRKCSLPGIQRALDDYTINLPWKRDLAEDEAARRQRHATAEGVSRNARDRSNTLGVWTILALLLAVVLLFIIASVFQLWH